MSLTVVMPQNEYAPPLLGLLEGLLKEKDWTLTDRLENLAGKRLLFAVPLDEGGCNEGCYRMLGQLRRQPELLEGCVAGIIVTGTGELYTKDLARELVLAANLAGCAFLGRPLVEATGSLRNFHTQAAIQGTGLYEAFRRAAAELLERLEGWSPLPPPRRVLALHASVRSTSNTLALWELVKRGLPPDVEIEELNLRNGTIADCSGCSYTTCLHFGEQGGCFYGGPMVEQVFPAVRRCDTLMMLCANYNDALSANLTAFINRLTALFRQTRLYDKRLYGLVVSGYSGGDLLAQQLISALNMNKSFFLPPRFVLLETANDKGSLLRLEGVEGRSAAFARRMMEKGRPAAPVDSTGGAC
ncbi:MAG: flavodoxin family protein [Oscillospiraceae bacterium]